jgi:wyosine [tRNA(Phe)-imidazoG37] synthetase (radical SAM superfamily)
VTCSPPGERDRSPARDEGPHLPIAFGPVRSRRLGWSLGINNVLPKSCTYSCVYCQVGATDRARRDRAVFYDPDEVVAAVGRHAAECRSSGQPIDYATFVPDGEPTLELGLGAAIRGIRAIGLPVAVLTSGSLLWRDDVAEELAVAELVSVKVDAVDAAAWRRVRAASRRSSRTRSRPPATRWTGCSGSWRSTR